MEIENEDEGEDLDELKDLSAVFDEYYGDTDVEAHEDRGNDQYLAINVLRKVLTTL